jgi:hypothetical protein
MKRQILKSKKTIVATLLLFIGLTGLAQANVINSSSSWDEIKADKTLKVSYPMVQVGHGMSSTIDNFYIEDEMLKTGRTWEDDSKFTIDREGDSVSLEKTTRNIETPRAYTYNKAVAWELDKDDSMVVAKTEKTQGYIPETHYVSVYKKSADEDKENTFLFKKAYTIPQI